MTRLGRATRDTTVHLATHDTQYTDTPGGREGEYIDLVGVGVVQMGQAVRVFHTSGCVGCVVHLLNYSDIRLPSITHFLDFPRKLCCCC